MAVHAELFMTEAEYDEWCWTIDEQTEFVDGRVIFLTPEPRLDERLRWWLGEVLDLYAARLGLGEVYGPNLQARLRPGLRRQPDIIFVSNATIEASLEETYLEGGPDLAVEIVSKKSRKRDRVEKFREYEQTGVQEYWIIEPRRRSVQAWHLAPDRHYEEIPVKDDVLRSRVLPGFWVRVSSLWEAPLPYAPGLLREMGISLDPEHEAEVARERAAREEAAAARDEATTALAREQAARMDLAARLEEERAARLRSEQELEALREGLRRRT